MVGKGKISLQILPTEMANREAKDNGTASEVGTWADALGEAARHSPGVRPGIGTQVARAAAFCPGKRFARPGRGKRQVNLEEVHRR
jgi:hypothetical protein